jgi:hypothetical protein
VEEVFLHPVTFKMMNTESKKYKTDIDLFICRK